MENNTEVMKRLMAEPLLQAYCRLVQHMRTAQEVYWQEAMRVPQNEVARINALSFARNLERAVDEETCKMLGGAP